MKKRSIGLWLVLFVVVGGLWACSDNGSDEDPSDGGLLGGSTNNGDNTDAQTSPDTAMMDDSGGVEEDTEEDVEQDLPPEVDFCEAAGLPSAALKEATGGWGYLDVAGDFTVNTLDGPWTLSEAWTGCESYVFLNYFPDLRSDTSGPWYVDEMWANSNLAEFLEESPNNVHYFFTSFQPTAADREAFMSELQERFNVQLTLSMDSELQEQWRSRLHFVTDRSTEIQGSAGMYMTDYLEYMFEPDAVVDLGNRGQAQPPLPLVFAIDRDQLWDPGGSLSEFVGGDSSLVMASFLGHFFNHKAQVAEQVSAEADVTVVNLLDEEVTERVLTQTVTLPDAADMATFDTLELDIAVTCTFRNPFACSEWDRIARISYCLDGAECTDRREIVRWITPYWRRGTRRWVIDASPFLAFMREGGEQTFFVEMGPGWERKTARQARMDLRLSQRGDKPRAIRIERAFTGGGFNAGYNDSKEPFMVDPGDASQVELVVLLSGHGQETGNCAEWCDHRHVFTLEGASVANIQSAPGIGELRTCAREARAGVPPGQWGNWAPGRAYWCPGLPVDLMHFDMTARLDAGRPEALLYRASFAGDEPQGGNISLSAYVVWYE